jgi:hypothetical protein
MSCARSFSAAASSTVEFLEPEEAERRYFGKRSDGLLAPPRVSIARALT